MPLVFTLAARNLFHDRVRFVATLAKTAQIKRQHIDAGRGQLHRQAVPNLAVVVALVQEQDSSAGFAGIARTSGTIGVVQNRPSLTPGVAKGASSAATARSHAATSWQPAAVAMP